MKKILFFIDSLFQGGAETLVKDYSLLLDQNLFKINVLCLKRLGTKYEEILENNGIKVFFLSDYLPCKIDSFLGKFLMKVMKLFNIDGLIAKSIIKRLKVDVIHAHLFTLDCLKRINPSSEIKLIYTVHNEPQKYWHGKTRLSRREFKACQWLVTYRKMQLIALHKEMSDELNSLFNVTNTIVVNNGIDFTKFENALTKPNIRKKLNIPLDAFVVGHIGRFVEQKNHLFLLEIFCELIKKKTNSILLLIGTGPLFNLFYGKIQQLGLEKNVLILNNRTDVPDLMNAMDVFAFPSIYEGLGIVLIEAQKMGLPCVISDKVPAAASISNLTTVVSLSVGADLWAEQLCKRKPRPIVYYGLDKWNMQNVVKGLENLYLRD